MKGFILYKSNKENSQYNVGYMLNSTSEGIYTILINRYGTDDMGIRKMNIVEYHINNYELNIDSVIIIHKEAIENKVSELMSKIKSVKAVDYAVEELERYNEIKNRIKNICSNMISDSSIEENLNFENRIKELHQLKKQLFSMECEECIEARKYNGNILYQIKEIRKISENYINRLNKDYKELKEKVGR